MSYPSEAQDAATRRGSHRKDTGTFRYFYDLDAVPREVIHKIVVNANYRSLVFYLPFQEINAVNRYFSPKDQQNSKAFFSILYLLLAQVVERGSLRSADGEGGSVILICQASSGAEWSGVVVGGVESN